MAVASTAFGAAAPAHAGEVADYASPEYASADGGYATAPGVPGGQVAYAKLNNKPKGGAGPARAEEYAHLGITARANVGSLGYHMPLATDIPDYAEPDGPTNGVNLYASVAEVDFAPKTGPR